jgi:hypothetical protein
VWSTGEPQFVQCSVIVVASAEGEGVGLLAGRALVEARREFGGVLGEAAAVADGDLAREEQRLRAVAADRDGLARLEQLGERRRRRRYR